MLLSQHLGNHKKLCKWSRLYLAAYPYVLRPQKVRVTELQLLSTTLIFANMKCNRRWPKSLYCAVGLPQIKPIHVYCQASALTLEAQDVGVCGQLVEHLQFPQQASQCRNWPLLHPLQALHGYRVLLVFPPEDRAIAALA